MTARRAEIGITITLFVGYASFYLCRANVDAALPLLQRAYGYDEDQLGLLSTLSVLAYAIGKVIMGALGDAIGGRRIMLVALGGSIVASFAFGMSSGLVALTAFAVMNRFFQSGGWGGLIHVVSRWFAPARHGTVMGVMATSYEIGNVITLLLCGAIVSTGASWRWLFRINPVLFAASGVMLALVLRGEPPPAPSASPAPKPPREKLSEVLPWLAKKPGFWASVVLSMLLTFVRQGFLNWTPVYLASIAEHGGTTGISGGIAKSAIFPAAGVVAATTIGRASDRFGPGRRAPLLVASLVLDVAAILALAHAPIRSPWAAAALIGLSGLFLLGPYSMLAGSLCLDVAGKRGTATAAGIIDGAGYFGASLVGVLLGGIAKRAGWSAAFDVVAAAAALAALVSAGWVLAGRRARAPVRS